MSVLGSIRDRLTDDTQPDTPEAAMTTGDALEILANKRRRHLIDTLHRLDPDDHTTTSDLTDHLAAREHHTRPSQLTSDQRKPVYVSVYQTHLPALDDAGIIDLDTHDVHPTPAVTALHRAKTAINQTLNGGQP